VLCCAGDIDAYVIIFRSVASSRKKSKKVQYVTKKEDLNKMRLSRYKMERYVYVRKGMMGERERES
jgi:hypothetical protein